MPLRIWKTPHQLLLTCISPRNVSRIADLLSVFPEQRETKAQKLLDGLGTLWRQNPHEKIVIFATYLGTVDLLSREIEQSIQDRALSFCVVAITAPRLQLNGASN